MQNSKCKIKTLASQVLKSGNETKFWLALAKDISPNLEQEINLLLAEVDELTKILGSSIATLKGTNKL